MVRQATLRRVKILFGSARRNWHSGRSPVRAGVAGLDGFIVAIKARPQWRTALNTKKIKWLIYTVLVGLIPILARFSAWAITKSGTVELLASSDFIAFGLVLHISNINEIEHLVEVDAPWKTLQNGVAITFIALYGVLFSAGLFGGDTVNSVALLIVSMILAAVSLALSYSVYDYLVHSSTEAP